MFAGKKRIRKMKKPRYGRVHLSRSRNIIEMVYLLLLLGVWQRAEKIEAMSLINSIQGCLSSFYCCDDEGIRIRDQIQLC